MVRAHIERSSQLFANTFKAIGEDPIDRIESTEGTI
jgi:hypothetical protein